MVDYPPTQRPYDFQRYADDFLKAYKDAGRALPPNWPKYFLGCHAVELELKVYLLSVGYDVDHLKTKFGHDIEKLVTEAVEKDLKIADNIQEDIRCLAQVHNSFWSRYPMERADPVLLIEQFDSSIDELFRVVRTAAFGQYPPAQLH